MSSYSPILVIVGPSGVGKTTIYRKLIRGFAEYFELSVSYTTRIKRPNDREGVDYYFVTNESFNKMKENSEFLESAIYVGNQYGTAVHELDRIRGNGKIPLLEIDIQGYKQIKQKGIELKGVFVMTRDMDRLRERLINRGVDAADAIKKRLNRAIQEIEESKKCDFDYRLMNDDLDAAYEDLKNKVIEWYPHACESQ